MSTQKPHTVRPVQKRHRWTRVELVLKGMVEQDEPRAFYRGSWLRSAGVLLGLIDNGWADLSFGRVTLRDLGCDAYINLGLWLSDQKDTP